jgi:hypothetical protein
MWFWHHQANLVDVMTLVSVVVCSHIHEYTAAAQGTTREPLVQRVRAALLPFTVGGRLAHCCCGAHLHVGNSILCKLI